jgi:acyl-coenzyme A synthetase/AMP-(fatty) acid ligase
LSEGPISAFVSLKAVVENYPVLVDELGVMWRRSPAIAPPGEILFAAGLAKTRSGKIMRRLLATSPTGARWTIRRLLLILR